MAANIDIFGNDSSAYPRTEGGMKFTGNAVMAFDIGAPGVAGGVGDAKAYAGMVVQNYNVSYQQNITKLRGLNRNEVWSVVAPPTGQYQMQVGLTGKKGFYDFMTKYGDACQTKTNTIHLKDGSQVCTVNADSVGGSMPDLTLQGCLASQLSLSQSVDNLVMMSNLTIEFVALDKNDNDNAGAQRFQNR